MPLSKMELFVTIAIIINGSVLDIGRSFGYAFNEVLSKNLQMTATIFVESSMK